MKWCHSRLVPTSPWHHLRHLPVTRLENAAPAVRQSSSRHYFPCSLPRFAGTAGRCREAEPSPGDGEALLGSKRSAHGRCISRIRGKLPLLRRLEILAVFYQIPPARDLFERAPALNEIILTDEECFGESLPIRAPWAQLTLLRANVGFPAMLKILQAAANLEECGLALSDGGRDIGPSPTQLTTLPRLRKLYVEDGRLLGILAAPELRYLFVRKNAGASCHFSAVVALTISGTSPTLVPGLLALNLTLPASPQMFAMIESRCRAGLQSIRIWNDAMTILPKLEALKDGGCDILLNSVIPSDPNMVHPWVYSLLRHEQHH
ncbi:hypothetical protein FB451DRAFT_1434503 [Mycena latifolia]|nr:hypothetical protein FB451DRAFT_1434503 [Mycena latifolia]